MSELIRSRSRQRPLRFAITTGDLNGVGLEVTLRALATLPLRKNIHFTVFRNPLTPRSLIPLEKVVSKKYSSRYLHFEFSKISPAHWVEVAAHGCLSGKFDAIITAPLSKELIVNSGVKGIGHTDIFKRIAKVKSVHMTFLGQHFNVLLATGHVPVKKISSSLTVEALISAIIAANRTRKLLPREQGRRPLALVALNPHAGEGGLIGREERLVYVKALTLAKQKKIQIVGPLVPDAAFLRENWGKYSLYVCPYHDQGLIPFKVVHGRDSGVHLSVGLPFVRTSVDHGTAKDIFGKLRANPNSMIEAINWARILAGGTKNGI